MVNEANIATMVTQQQQTAEAEDGSGIVQPGTVGGFAFSSTSAPVAPESDLNEHEDRNFEIARLGRIVQNLEENLASRGSLSTAESSRLQDAKEQIRQMQSVR